jgi:hypothetical protein
MGLAGAGVANRDDVLPAGHILRAGELQHEGLVERRNGGEVEAVEALHGREPRLLEASKAKPYYDRMNLVLAVKAAAESFQDAWFPRLGLQHKPGVGKEHWTRVKALSRRLATGMADHYDSLQPVADLRKELQDRIYVFVQNPLSGTGQSRGTMRSRGSSIH